MVTVTGQQEDMILLPRTPTKEMLEEGWYEASAENAAGVWRDMIAAWESSAKKREIGKR